MSNAQTKPVATSRVSVSIGNGRKVEVVTDVMTLDALFGTKEAAGIVNRAPDMGEAADNYQAVRAHGFDAAKVAIGKAGEALRAGDFATFRALSRLATNGLAKPKGWSR